MRPETWTPLYDKICHEFKFSKRADLASAKLLASMIGDKGERSLTAIRANFPKRVLLCGGGEGLADELSSIIFDGTVVAADGATTVVLEAGLKVDMIVTDLDGIVEDQIDQNSKGAVVFVHAHGDNQPALRRYTDRFTGPVIGTCQCAPPPQLCNFGGFTDGDRAACICADLGTTEILLAGFDFDNPSEKAGRDAEVKRKKLAWAKRIMDIVRQQGVRIVSASELEK